MHKQRKTALGLGNGNVGVLIVGGLLFLLPFVVAWWRAQGVVKEVQPPSFRGVQVLTMDAGVHEGLSWVYAWGPALGLRRSIDGGRTWSSPIPLPDDWRPFSHPAFAVDPHDGRHLLLLLPFSRGQTLYRLDNALAWQLVRTFAEEKNAPLLVAPAPDGLYLGWGITLWTWNTEGEWRVLHKWDAGALSGITSFLGHREIVLATVGHMWRSADGGEHWKPLDMEAEVVISARAPSGDAYALGRGTVWHSTDWGISWVNLHIPVKARAIAVPAIYPDVVYALDVESRVWRWGPNSAEWQVIHREREMSVRGLLADPAQAGRLYIFGHDGLRIIEDPLPPPTPTPTYTPTDTATPSPTPSWTPTPTATSNLSSSPEEAPSPTVPAPTPTATPTPSPTATRTPSPTVPRRHTRAPTATATPTPTPTPTPPPPVPPPTPTPRPTPTPTPTPFHTPTPTPTPLPTPTPTRTPGPPPER